MERQHRDGGAAGVRDVARAGHGGTHLHVAQEPEALAMHGADEALGLAVVAEGAAR